MQNLQRQHPLLGDRRVDGEEEQNRRSGRVRGLRPLLRR